MAITATYEDRLSTNAFSPIESKGCSKIKSPEINLDINGPLILDKDPCWNPIEPTK